MLHHIFQPAPRPWANNGSGFAPAPTSQSPNPEENPNETPIVIGDPGTDPSFDPDVIIVNEPWEDTGSTLTPSETLLITELWNITELTTFTIIAESTDVTVNELLIVNTDTGDTITFASDTLLATEPWESSSSTLTPSETLLLVDSFE